MVVLNLHDDDIQNRAGETLVQCTDPCGRSKHVHTVGSLLLVQRQQSFRCVGSRVSGLARAVMRQRGGPARRRLRSRGRRPAAAQGGGRYFIHRPPLGSLESVRSLDARRAGAGACIRSLGGLQRAVLGCSPTCAKPLTQAHASPLLTAV